MEKILRSAALVKSIEPLSPHNNTPLRDQEKDMRLKSRKLTASILRSSSEFWHRVLTTAGDRLLRNSNQGYNRSKQAEDFLKDARACLQRNDTENALATLEAGLNEYPGAESLLANYLRICCEHERLVRIIDFINPTNKQLCRTLARLDILDFAPDHPFIDGTLDPGPISLTDEIIGKNFADDALKLWRLADLLERSNKIVIANKIHRRLSSRATHTPDDYSYGGVSDMRLGDIEGGFEKLVRGLAAFPGSESISLVFGDCCYSHIAFDRYLRLNSILGKEEGGESRSALNFYRRAFERNPPEAFLLKFKDVEFNCNTDEFFVLKSEFLALLRDNEVTAENAKLLIFWSKFLDLSADFSERMFLILYHLDWGKDEYTTRYSLMLLYKLTLPVTPHYDSYPEEVIRRFSLDAEFHALQPIALHDPITDFSKHWAVWQSLFCLDQPRLYHQAMSAFEMLAFRLWPGLDYTAPHIHHPLASQGTSNRKIRIGFTVLDSMPMMSGFMELLDKEIFETVFLRPGAGGESRTATDWVARAGTTVEYSGTDAYSAINTIANQELDILISGPSVPQIFFPLMARLAHLHMVLLEPNWPDGLKNSDYYISWQMAEPENYKDFYKTPVSLLQNPPYWIERSSLGEISAVSDEACNNIRQRLLGLAPEDRFYICANTSPKLHPVMDEMFCSILEGDPACYLVFLRSEHAMSSALKARLRQKMGRYYERVKFLNTLKKVDAHSLLLSADCCIDSYPIGGMSSSFDGLMLGVPIVTLPADVPFGRWTAAIYEYIGVSGLTARDVDEYISIAMRLAIDKDWRVKKSAEIREKSSRYIESKVSFDEFQHFIVQAWGRKQAGLPPGNWVGGEWQ